MGEVKKIVVDHYPVDKLPEELRWGLESGEVVRVTVEAEADAEPASAPRGLASLIGAGRGIYVSPEEAVAAIRALREEWE